MTTMRFCAGFAACTTLTAGAFGAPANTPSVSPLDAGSGAPGAFAITASTPDGRSATWSAPEGWTGTGSDIELRDPRGVLLGSVRLGSEQFRSGGGPFVSLSLAVLAGPQSTTFTIGSALLSFTPPWACGRAFGTSTLTDLNQNGAEMNGLIGGKAYGAYINGFLDVTGTLAYSAVDPMIVEPFGSASQPFDSGCLDLGDVSSMSAQWKFSLSAGDQFEATSSFQLGKCCVVPVPTGAAMGLAGLGVLAGIRRRR